MKDSHQSSSDFGSLLWEEVPTAGIGFWVIIVAMALVIGALTTTPDDPPAASPPPEHIGRHQ